MTLQGLPAPAVGAGERSDEDPTAGRLEPEGCGGLLATASGRFGADWRPTGTPHCTATVSYDGWSSEPLRPPQWTHPHARG